jgi:pimeloyl-ACP methyl ester carboxylesterase
VLVGSGGIGRSVSPMLRLAAVPGIEALMPLFGLPPVRMVTRLTADVMRHFATTFGRDTEELLAVFDALPDNAARTAILRTLRSGVDWRGQVITMLDRAYLAEGMPTLLVWGRHDGVIPLGHGRLAHAAMPGSELEIFDEAGHFPHHSDPTRFVRIVADFVERTEPAPFDAEEWRRRLRRGRQAVETETSESDLELMALALSPLPGAH